MSARARRRLVALAGAQLIIALDHNIVYVVLPVIDRELGFGGTSEQWVVSSYSLAFGGLLLVGGRLADAFGPHDVFVAALAVYAAASALGGLAGAPAVLVCARASQGAGGALLFPATVAALKAGFADGPERARALAAWGAAGAAGGAAGSLAGGTLAAALGWRAVFLVNLPIVALVAGAGWAVVGGPPRDGARAPWRHLPHAVAGAAAVTLLLLGATQAAAGAWAGPALACVLVAAALLAGAFRALERRSADPLVPRHVLRRGPAAAAVAAAFAFMAAFGSQLYLLTVYLQEGRGAGPFATGVALLPLTAAVLAGTQLGGRLVRLLGDAAATVAGLLAGAAGMLVCAAAVAAASAPALAVAMIAVGLGQGATWTAMWGLATAGSRPRDGVVAGTGATAAPRGHDGVVAGVVATAQQLGGAAGLAVLVSIVAAGRPAVDDGIAWSFAAAAALLAAAALVTPRLARVRRPGCG